MLLYFMLHERPSPWVWRRSGQRLKAAWFGWRDDGREVLKVCGKREMKSRFLKKSGEEEEIHQTQIQVGYPPPAAHGLVRNWNPNNPQPMCTHRARALKTCNHWQTAHTLAPTRAWCVSTPSPHRARSAWLVSSYGLAPAMAWLHDSNSNKILYLDIIPYVLDPPWVDFNLRQVGFPSFKLN